MAGWARTSVRSGWLAAGTSLACAAWTTPVGAQPSPPVPAENASISLEAQIAELRKAAEQARKDAKAAEESAARAEALIRDLLDRQSGSSPRPVETAQADIAQCAKPVPPSQLSASPYLDCDYSFRDYVERTDAKEDQLLGHLATKTKGPDGKEVWRTGGPPPRSLGSSTGNFRGAITASKKGTNVSLVNDFPLSRLKEDDEEGNLRAITRTLSLGASATFDEDNGGYIGDFSDLSDKPLGLSLGFSMQYYPWRPKSSEKKDEATLATLGKEKVAALVALCRADQKKTADDAKLQAEIFDPERADSGAASAGADNPCRYENLLRWAFATKKHGAFKRPDAIDAYNAGFWITPGKEELPEFGFGLSGEFTRQRFSFIDPAGFAPSVLLPATNPPLLSTLKFETLGGDRKVTYDWSLNGYVFYHWPVDLPLLDGLTLIPRAKFGRKWSIAKAAKDIEFCTIDPPLAGGVPVAGANNRKCEKFNILPPSRDSGFELGAEVRTRIPLTRLHRYLPEIGLAPSFTYSEIEDRYKAVAPFYVAFDKENGLNGGLQLSHEWGGGEDKATVISIFYSTPFTLAGNK